MLKMNVYQYKTKRPIRTVEHSKTNAVGTEITLVMPNFVRAFVPV